VLGYRLVISFRRRGGALLLGIATGSLLIGGVAIAAPATVVPTSLQTFLGAGGSEQPTTPSAAAPRPSWKTATPVAAALPTAAPVPIVQAPPPPAPEPAPTTAPDAVPVRAILGADADAPKAAEEPEEAGSDDDSDAGSGGSLSRAAADVVRKTNEERREAGCADLAPDSRLTSAAQQHATDMAENDYFAHNSEDGTRFDQRIRAAGHTRPGGENIAMGQTSAGQVVQEWMDSPPHRRNILNCAFTTIGVGVDDNYWVQDFGR
jgi:uncharacterized protein YkwD